MKVCVKCLKLAKLNIDSLIINMNNNESMRWFVNYVDISTDNIVEDFGTEIILQHEDFNFKLAVDSHGLGDFYSHAFVVSIVD